MTLDQEESSTVEWLELFFDLVVVAAIAVLVPNNWLTLGLLACVGWMVAYSRLAQARVAAGGAVTRAG